VTCYLSPLYFQVKGESHASVCGSRSHALIPTGARSRPAALPKPIIISAPKPHCWKGSASKPYVELPPHTAPLGIGMEVGPVPACAVKVVVHDFIKKERIGSWRLLACLPSDPAFSLLDISKRGLRSAPREKINLILSPGRIIGRKNYLCFPRSRLNCSQFSCWRMGSLSRKACLRARVSSKRPRIVGSTRHA
jgi:hypothetical protein